MQKSYQSNWRNEKNPSQLLFGRADSRLWIGRYVCTEHKKLNQKYKFSLFKLPSWKIYKYHINTTLNKFILESCMYTFTFIVPNLSLFFYLHPPRVSDREFTHWSSHPNTTDYLYIVTILSNCSSVLSFLGENHAFSL